MQVTIDKLGRILVPKALRDRYHLTAGTLLNLEPDNRGVQFSVVLPKSTLVEKDGILIHQGSQVIDLDVTAFLNQERENRNLAALGKDS
ncbi:MAG: AbrB/MazE/SpoVT family DNA-binding domain-containing protein [Spirochaetales bacterium]